MKCIIYINEIKNTQGTNAKLDLLREYIKDETFQKVLFYTYNPFFNYYVKKIPAFSSHSTIANIDGMFLLLDDLRCRKFTGNTALEYISSFLARSNEDLVELTKLILDRDLKMGINTSSINKTLPNLIPTFDVMLADAKIDIDNLLTKHDYLYVQKKSDGKRCITMHSDGAVTFYARSGKEIENLYDNEPLVNSLNTLRLKLGYDYVLDGEVIIINADGTDADRQYSNGLINRKNLPKDESSRFSLVVWDIMPHSEFLLDNSTLPYVDRLYILNRYIKDQYSNLNMIETHKASTTKSINDITNRFIDSGFEGSIVKTPDHLYTRKRSKCWIKFKKILEADLRVTNFVYGTPGTKYETMLGALELESEDGLVKVGVGSGFTDADRSTITPDIIGSIVTVQYNQLIENKNGGTSLYLPRFIEIRTDKDAADNLNKIKNNG